VKSYLTAKGVPFINRDIGENEQAVEELAEMGMRVVPVIVIDDGEVIAGFDKAKLDEALQIK
jgi:glutaredoxin